MPASGSCQCPAPAMRIPPTSSSSAAAPLVRLVRLLPAAADGLRVVLLEKGTLGEGASSRAAGVVRAQGGTPEARARSAAVVPEASTAASATNSASTPASWPQGYLLPCFTDGRGQPRPGEPDGHAAGPRAWTVELARPGPKWTCSIPPRARADARRDLLRARRLSRPAAQRHRLHGRARGQRRYRPRAASAFTGLLTRGRPGSPAWRPARARSPRRRPCSPAALSLPRWAGLPECGSRRAGSGTRSR